MIRLDTAPDETDKIYARSVYELAEARGGRALLEELSGELDEISDLIRANPRLAEFVASRIIPSEKKEASLKRMFGGRISELLMSTILVLNRKGRLGQFMRVAAAFQMMVEEKFGRIEVDVYTRFPLPPDQADYLRGVLRERMGREPVLYSYTDASMLGGFKLRVGDKLLDASFATRLRKMRDRIKEDGGKEIRARFERAVEDKGNR
jgi:F-type H+-transporting ATPase subunit delta